MTDSETLARLIYRAFVLAQEGLLKELEARVPFPDALELYAKTRMRELIEEGKLELVSESDAAPHPAEEAPPAPAPDLPPEPADTHTHTHSRGH